MNELLILKSDVVVNKFDSVENSCDYILSFQNRNWKVSSIVFLICQELKTSPKTEEEIRQLTVNGIQISPQVAVEVISFFRNNGLVEGSLPEKIQGSRNKNLWARITIFSQEKVLKFHFLSILFSKWIVVPMVLLCFCFFGFVLVSYSSESISIAMQSLSLEESIICYIIMILVGIFHEFGHSAALMRYGEYPRRIGVAIYFIMPVLFSDVTNAWKLNKRERCIVDLGGIYFQLIISMLIFVANKFIFNSYIIETAIVVSMLQVMGNLNPFIKMDGYWFVCDALGITSPLPFIFNVLTNPFRNKTNHKYAITTIPLYKKIIIYLYSITTIAFLGYFFAILGNSAIVAINNIAFDIRNVVDNSGSIIFSFENFWGYLSSRFTTYIVLLFIIRMVVRILARMIRYFAEILGRKTDVTGYRN